MSETKKLQKAVELTITAGYQLNEEAFKFLSMLAATQDPTAIMNKALKRIEALKEKPLFINRSILEELTKETETAKEEDAVTSEQPSKQNTETQDFPMTGRKIHFQPYAKDVEFSIDVIEDPSTNISSDGTIEDYLGYFRDRFKRLEKLLRQRIDVRSAASIIDALRAPSNTILKIIGMITEKRESKKRVFLSVEDLQTGVTLLVPQNASEEVQRRARQLLLDQVVCFNVQKTRSSLLIVEDIILPEIGQKPQHKAPVPVLAALTSDMHIGSTKFQRGAFDRFILWLNGKYGNERMRDLAGHVKYVIIAGDIVDGIGVYPNQIEELAIKDINKQYRLAAEYIDQIPDHIGVVIIPGNHDSPRKALPQPAIKNDYLKPLQESRKLHSFGNPCWLSLHNVEVLVYHGRSLDDVIATIPDMSHNNPEKAMRLLLQSRHLAPTYGEKTMLSPESKDLLTIERIPDIFHAGHIHALGYTNYRGVLIVNSGGWQEQTEYMKRLGFAPTPGKVPLVNLQTLETTVVSFN